MGAMFSSSPSASCGADSPYSGTWECGALRALVRGVRIGSSAFWGLPFLIAGVYFVIGRFIHDAALRKTVVYAVTDQRVLMMGGLVSTRFSSLDIRRLPKLELTEHRDGTGTIDFEGGDSMRWSGGGFDEWTPALGRSKRFFRISNAREAYQIIRKQAEA